METETEVQPMSGGQPIKADPQLKAEPVMYSQPIVHPMSGGQPMDEQPAHNGTADQPTSDASSANQTTDNTAEKSADVTSEEAADNTADQAIDEKSVSVKNAESAERFHKKRGKVKKEKEVKERPEKPTIKVPGCKGFSSYRSSMQEYTQKKGLGLPSYTDVRTKGGYVATCVFGDGITYQGSCGRPTTKEACQQVAYEALVGIGYIDKDEEFQEPPKILQAGHKRKLNERVKPDADPEEGGPPTFKQGGPKILYKSKLAELAQKYKVPLPTYDSTPTAHGYMSTVNFHNQQFTSSQECVKKRDSEQSAAQNALYYLQHPAYNPSYAYYNQHGGYNYSQPQGPPPYHEDTGFHPMGPGTLGLGPAIGPPPMGGGPMGAGPMGAGPMGAGPMVGHMGGYDYSDEYGEMAQQQQQQQSGPQPPTQQIDPAGCLVLHMKGLPFQCTKQDIRDFFGKDMEIAENGITLVRDHTGKCMGYGYVEFTSKDHGKNALIKCNREHIKGRWIKLWPSKKEDTKVGHMLHMRGIGLRITRKQPILDFFAPVVPLRISKILKGKCYVEFETKEDAELSFLKDRQEIQGRYIELSLINTDDPPEKPEDPSSKAEAEVTTDTNTEAVKETTTEETTETALKEAADETTKKNGQEEASCNHTPTQDE